MQGNVRIYPDTRYRAFDFATASGIRCVGLGFDGLELGIALGDDAEVIAAINALDDELGKLRVAALDRIADAADLCKRCGGDHDRIDPIETPCDPLPAIAELAAIDAESPAEGHEVVAEWTRGTA